MFRRAYMIVGTALTLVVFVPVPLPPVLGQKVCLTAHVPMGSKPPKVCIDVPEGV